MSEIEVGPGVYTLRWTEYDISIVVDRLKENSSHEVHSEWVVRHKTLGHLTRSRVSLLGPRSKADMVKELEASRAGGTVDWKGIVEETAGKVLEEYRRGEPVVILGDVTVNEALEWRARPLILEGEATVLFGYSGLGKSWIGNFLSTYVQEGVMDNGLEVEPGQVLFLDYETSKNTAARRFSMIHAGLGIQSSSRVLYRHCYQPLANEVSEVMKIVHGEGVQMVVVDSAGPACGGEPEQAGPALAYWNALRSLKVSSFTIAHKSKVSNSQGPFGSVFWTNIPRSVYEISKSQATGAQTLNVALVHRNANDTPLQHAKGFSLTFDEHAIYLSTTNLAHDKDLIQVLSDSDPTLRYRMAEALSHGSLDVKELVDQTGIQETSLRSQFSRHKDWFIKLSDNTYGLVAQDHVWRG